MSFVILFLFFLHSCCQFFFSLYCKLCVHVLNLFRELIWRQLLMFLSSACLLSLFIDLYDRTAIFCCPDCCTYRDFWSACRSIYLSSSPMNMWLRVDKWYQWSRKRNKLVVQCTWRHVPGVSEWMSLHVCALCHVVHVPHKVFGKFAFLGKSQQKQVLFTVSQLLLTVKSVLGLPVHNISRGYLHPLLDVLGGIFTPSTSA